MNARPTTSPASGAVVAGIVAGVVLWLVLWTAGAHVVAVAGPVCWLTVIVLKLWPRRGRS